MTRDLQHSMWQRVFQVGCKAGLPRPLQVLDFEFMEHEPKRTVSRFARDFQNSIVGNQSIHHSWPLGWTCSALCFLPINPRTLGSNQRDVMMQQVEEVAADGEPLNGNKRSPACVSVEDCSFSHAAW